MSKMVPTPPPGFDDLSVDEQIDFVQSLWDRIAATSWQVPVPEWHRQIIRERLARTIRTPALADSGQMSAQTSSENYEIVEISDSPGGMPLLMPLFMVELP